MSKIIFYDSLESLGMTDVDFMDDLAPLACVADVDLDGSHPFFWPFSLDDDCDLYSL